MPGSLRFTSGELADLLKRAASVTYSSEEPDHPGDNAINGNVGKAWITEGEATEYLIADLCLLSGYGSMESFPAGFTSAHTGTGSSAIDAASFFAGAKSAKLLAGASGVALSHIDVEVAAGEELRILAALRITSGSGTVQIRVQCLQTRQWLVIPPVVGAFDGAAFDEGAFDASDPDAETGPQWQTTEDDLFSSTSTASWAEKDETFEAPTYAETGLDKLTLRIYMRSTSNCTANVDELHIWPLWDVASIHGHNADPSQAIALYGGASAPSTLIATLTKPAATPSCYIRASVRQSYRFVKILFPAENVEALHAGEVCLWQSRVPQLGWTGQRRKFTPLQARAATLAGHQGVIRMGKTRTVELDLMSIDPDTRIETFEELWTRTNEGLHPIIVIPDDELQGVIYGRVPANEQMETPMTATTITNYTITIVEDGLPTVGL